MCAHAAQTMEGRGRGGGQGEAELLQSDSGGQVAGELHDDGETESARGNGC